MESAKKAVKSFLHKAGKHETDIQERVAPAVTHENIERRQHEEVTTVVDKEIHQDHYHTTIQPITDTEVLPEQHHYRVAPTEHREVDHGDTSSTQRQLHAAASQFQNETTQTEGASTTTAGTATGSTHVHHHVHETIQPVLEKRVIERHVIHTIVPVHETHHNPAEHYETSTRPVVSMEEAQRSGGVLTGGGERAVDRQSPSQLTGSSLAGSGSLRGGQSSQARATTGSPQSGTTGVAGNAAISAARAAALGQRPV